MNGFGNFKNTSIESSISDANKLINAGYYMSSNFTNVPYNNNGTWWHIHVIRHNDIYTVQIAYQFTTQNCPVYIRAQTNGKWGSWRNFNPGTATAAQVLSGYTFSSANGSNLSGTMTNRGALNWSGSNTTYTVPAGYYSGGTLNSKTSYTNGYNAGVTAADNRANANSMNYKSGRTQGQNDVKNSPNSYGLYTKSQYDANYNNGVNAGKNAIYAGKTGTFSTGSIGNTATVNTGLSEIRLLVCYVTDGTNGMLNYSANNGQRCVRGNSWLNDVISISGGTFYVNAKNSNYASRSWNWHAIGK